MEERLNEERMKWKIFQEELDRQVEFTDLYPDPFNTAYHFTLCVYMIRELGGLFYGQMVSYTYLFYISFSIEYVRERWNDSFNSLLSCFFPLSISHSRLPYKY